MARSNRPCPMHKSPQAGFTLAEVLVALAVLAIALAAVLGVVSQSIHTTVALRDRTQAMWLAQDRLTLHQLQHDWPALDTTTGVTEDGGRKWYWREQVSSSPQTEMRRIEIEIRESENKEVLAHLAGYLRRY
jgi:general secretion pathway protein I